ncbi:MAG: methyltransferase domain-containing protein [Solirubrobacteraceae bacterium]|nr:methyltransferase domain-containing protein [Solirubrobacteraceae bacterium]
MTDPGLLREFEARFGSDPDPWGFETSDYEAAKREATIRACRPLVGKHVLELGSANGVLAADLARSCAQLVAVDAVPAAAERARERLRRAPHAMVVVGLIPHAVPVATYDVVVASEILYYLDDEAYASTLGRMETWLAAGGRVVAVHWRPPGTERPRSATDVHEDLARLPFLRLRETADTDDYLLSVLDRR